jgi:hypothetical protein
MSLRVKQHIIKEPVDGMQGNHHIPRFHKRRELADDGAKAHNMIVPAALTSLLGHLGLDKRQMEKVGRGKDRCPALVVMISTAL